LLSAQLDTTTYKKNKAFILYLKNLELHFVIQLVNCKFVHFVNVQE
jgi:hypothetical protein